jgi:hypothetical protein
MWLRCDRRIGAQRHVTRTKSEWKIFLCWRIGGLEDCRIAGFACRVLACICCSCAEGKKEREKKKIKRNNEIVKQGGGKHKKDKIHTRTLSLASSLFLVGHCWLIVNLKMLELKSFWGTKTPGENEKRTVGGIISNLTLHVSIIYYISILITCSFYVLFDHLEWNLSLLSISE